MIWCVSVGKNYFLLLPHLEAFNDIGEQSNSTLFSTTENLIVWFVLWLNVGEMSCSSTFKSL